MTWDARDGSRYSPWDRAQLGGVDVPGVVSVTARPDHGVDIQKPKGGKRARLSDDGDPPIRMDMTVTLMPSEYPDFKQLIVPLVRKRDTSGGRPPLSFVHPEADLWGVDTVTALGIRSNPPSSGGFKVIVIELVEWVASPKKVKHDNRVRRGTTTLHQPLEQPDAPSGAEPFFGEEIS